MFSLSYSQGTCKGALCFLVSCCVIFPGAAVAQTVAGPVPPARESAIPVIDSVAAADAALAAVNLERTAQEARHASARRLCFDKLLAERCLVNTLQFVIALERSRGEFNIAQPRGRRVVFHPRFAQASLG